MPSARPGRRAPRRQRPGSPTSGRAASSGGPDIPRSLKARQQHARGRLRRFRQASILAIALTGLFLVVWDAPDGLAQEVPGLTQGPASPPLGADPGSPAATGAAPPGQAPPGDTLPTDPREGVAQATGTVRDLILGFYGFLPQLIVAILLLLVAGLITRVVRPILRRSLGHWEKAEATSALVGILIWLVALGAALSVIAGDARALVGSVGLFGLALSWALQTPIESFTGWLINSFRGYYRIGDRIAVGEVFGDVYEIDFLTTTVWEAGGGAEKAVRGEQPTGVLITFPNAEVLRSSIVNFTRGFPFVWDEVTLQLDGESDLDYTVATFAEVARQAVGTAMAGPADEYRRILEETGLGLDVPAEPHVFVSFHETWLDLTVRYLIPARERRRWSTALTIALAREAARPEHRGRIIPGMPLARIELGEDGNAAATGTRADGP